MYCSIGLLVNVLFLFESAQKSKNLIHIKKFSVVFFYH